LETVMGQDAAAAADADRVLGLRLPLGRWLKPVGLSMLRLVLLRGPTVSTSHPPYTSRAIPYRLRQP
jgi:hypothetical protein